MTIDEIILQLEHEWDTDGFLYAVRSGCFDTPRSKLFLSLLRCISVDEEGVVPKRLLALIWYLPSFLEWQKERVAKVMPTSAEAYARFVTEVFDTLEEVIGVP